MSRKSIDFFENMLKSKFEIKRMGNVRYYIGLEIDRDKFGNFNLKQESYINKVIGEFQMSDAKPSDYPLDPGYGKSKMQDDFLLNNKQYQKLIGCLLYVAINSRPDIAASVSILSRKVCQPSKEDWVEAKRVLRYLKNTANFKLSLSVEKYQGNVVKAYADADWAADQENRKSNSGYVFLVYGGVVSWCYRK